MLSLLVLLAVWVPVYHAYTRRQIKPCPSCGFLIIGSLAEKCPECGATITHA